MSSSIGTRDSQRLNQSASANQDTGSSRFNNSELMGSVVGTLSFTAGGTISDSASGFVNRGFAVGDVVEVVGSPLNSRTYTLTAVTTTDLTVLPAIVQTESTNNIAYVRRVN